MTALATDPYHDYTPTTIAPKDMGLAMRMLSTDYTRPVDAAIREIAANALDSQVAAGNNAPVKISLPTLFDPKLTITDQGLGMTLREATETFANFVSSSKRDDDEAMGVYGVGAKAPFAVADQYYLTTIKNGVKSYLRFVLQESGIPLYKVLDSSLTTEPNGVSLTIPIPPSEGAHSYNYWVQCAQRVLYWWEPGSVVVTSHPETEFPSFREDIDEKLSTDEVLFLTHKRGAHFNTTTPMIRMGSIAYEINSAMHQHLLSDGSYVIQAPIKSYEVTQPREGVKHSPDVHERLRLTLNRWRTVMKKRYLPLLETAKTSFDLYKLWKLMPKETQSDIARSNRQALITFSLPHQINVDNLQFIASSPRKRESGLWVEDFEHLDGALFVAGPQSYDARSRRIIQEWRRENRHRTVFVIADPTQLMPFIDPDALEWTTIEQLKEDTPQRARVKIPTEQIRMDRLTRYISTRYQTRSSFAAENLLIKDIMELLATGLPLVIGSREEIEEFDYTTKELLGNAVVIARGSRTAVNAAKLLGNKYFTPQSHLEHLRSIKVAAMSAQERQLVVDRSSLSNTVLRRVTTWHKYSAKTTQEKALVAPLVALATIPLDGFLAADPAMPPSQLAQQMPLLLALLKCSADPENSVVVALAKLDAQNAARAARKPAKR